MNTHTHTRTTNRQKAARNFARRWHQLARAWRTDETANRAAAAARRHEAASCVVREQAAVHRRDIILQDESAALVVAEAVDELHATQRHDASRLGLHVTRVVQRHIELEHRVLDEQIRRRVLERQRAAVIERDIVAELALAHDDGLRSERHMHGATVLVDR